MSPVPTLRVNCAGTAVVPGRSNRGELPGSRSAGVSPAVVWASEGVKELGKEKDDSRKDAKAQRVAKQTKGFTFALLCVFATLRDIV